MADLLDGRVEITLEKADQEQGDYEEPNEQGDQNISNNAVSSGGGHLFPKDLALRAIRSGENFSLNRFAL